MHENKGKPVPRIYPLMASQAPYTLFLRRGPSGQVCTIGWWRDTDRFEVGQWFRAVLMKTGRTFHQMAGI